MNKFQLDVYNDLKKIINNLSGEIEYSFGFGSFWQDFSNYNNNSDIDFLVITNNESSFNSLIDFFKQIEELNKKYNCKCSPQIFVGKYRDLFNSTDNILRLLTIANKNKKTIELYNKKNYEFYKDIEELDIDILKISKQQIFNIVRFYNRDFYKYKINVDMYRYREVKFLFNAIHSYYKIHPKSKKARDLILKIDIYYKNYNQYLDNKLFHQMLMELVKIVSGG